MNTLYFVKTYNHSTNWWARFLVSADTPANAAEAVQLALLDSGWSRLELTVICLTDDDVFLEV